MPPTHTPTICPMSIKGISMFLYRKQIFVILPFHFSWLNWVRRCCSISANFCIVYSCSTFRPSDHAYCQLYQFNSLTFHSFWQFHSMESNRSSSSINSNTFSSIGSITYLIETIYYIISMPSVGGGGNLTKMEKFWIDLCPLHGSFFSQFGAENSKRHGVYLQKKGPPSVIYNFNL